MKTSKLIQSDCYRICGKSNLRAICKLVFDGETFKYLFWMRLCVLFDKNIFYKVFFFPISKLLLNHYKFKYGISLSYRTEVGYGLYLPHFGGVVINDNTVLGHNVVISQGVTIGKTDRGKYQGAPIIGDNTFVGPNAVIVGGIVIGKNALIAPNAFVNFNVPDNAVVSGNPASIISKQGANEYIKRPWLTEQKEESDA